MTATNMHGFMTLLHRTVFELHANSTLQILSARAQVRPEGAHFELRLIFNFDWVEAEAAAPVFEKPSLVYADGIHALDYMAYDKRMRGLH